jgi:hypothetical protein
MKSNRAVSHPTLRLGGGHDTGYGPGTAPPEPPAQPATGNVAHPDFGKPCLVLPGGPHVGDNQPTAGTQNPNRFVDRASGCTTNLTDRSGSSVW